MANQHEELQTRVAKLYADLKASIFTKMPMLNGRDPVYMPNMYFEKLTDEEFVVLWTLPNLVFHVNEKTGAYIEERRKRLGLKRMPGSEVKKGK
jgi:transcriptional regulator